MSTNHKQVATIISNSFSIKKKLNIIDYGCGSGELLNHISRNKIKSYIGYEINKNSIKMAEKMFEKYTFKKISKQKLPSLGEKNSIDVLVLVGVLQYMKSSEIKYLFKEARRVLNKSGILVISCSTDHGLYKFCNIYQFFLPNHFINRRTILEEIEKAQLKTIHQQERGILIAPLFSNIISFFFDAGDKVLFRTKGTLGPIGSFARKIVNPLIALEYLVPIDYGYTLYLKIQKR